MTVGTLLAYYSAVPSDVYLANLKAMYRSRRHTFSLPGRQRRCDGL